MSEELRDPKRCAECGGKCCKESTFHSGKATLSRKVRNGSTNGAKNFTKMRPAHCKSFRCEEWLKDVREFVKEA